MKDIKETKTISDLLNTFTFGEKSKGKSLSDTIKQSTVFSFWNDIAGAKFAKFTKPVKIKYSKLYVSAKSPVIVQELNLVKSKLINKANTYSNALGFQIKDIIFDYKNYIEEAEKNEEIIQNNLPEFYDNKKLEDISVDKNYISQIEDNISKINFLSQNQKSDLVNKIINVKKAKIKRTSN